MRNILTTIAIFMSTCFCVSAQAIDPLYFNSTYFIACEAATNAIVPPVGTVAGFAPTDSALPCSKTGIYISDTIHFHNYHAFAGLTVDYLTFDSIYLPAGLCWSTNKVSNSFTHDEDGIILIQGTTTAPAGQYKLRIIIDLSLGSGVLSITKADAEALAGVRYRLRIECPNNTCLALNTTDTTDAYIADSRSCIASTVTPAGPITLCQGDSVILTAAGGSGYTYHWSTGATSQSIVAKTTNSYTVTITASGNPIVSSPVVVTVNTPRPNYAISAGGPTTFCNGGSVTLNAGSGYTSYNWSTGSTQSSITAFTTAPYSVTATGTDGCRYKDTIAINANAQPSISNFQITASGPTTFCQGGSVTLSAGSGFSSYGWSTGSSLPTITASNSGTYDVTVYDSLHCLYYDTISVNASSTVSNQSICIVSVDAASGKNQIIWEKPTGTNTDSFKIYKETTIAGSYQLIRAQQYSDFSTYTDAASDPTQQSSKYVITAVSQCGESQYSTPHQTIHLTSNLGVGGVVNLLWNAYAGFTYPSFNIYRGSSASNMQMIATISSGNFSYTDQTPPAPPLYYQIEVVNPNGCVPSKTDGYSSSLSNVINVNQTGIQEFNTDHTGMYYAADANSTGAIHFSQEIKEPTDIKMYDLSGRVVMKSDNWTGSILPIDAGTANGVYIVVAQNSTMSISRKISILR